ncbi:hypothetical protein SC1_00476 [Sphingopyxis sp. C-1]|nr:hypothetical protein SC1_00476 [Sphingopyxis sp. C-1]
MLDPLALKPTSRFYRNQSNASNCAPRGNDGGVTVGTVFRKWIENDRLYFD